MGKVVTVLEARCHQLRTQINCKTVPRAWALKKMMGNTQRALGEHPCTQGALGVIHSLRASIHLRSTKGGIETPKEHSGSVHASKEHSGSFHASKEPSWSIHVPKEHSRGIHVPKGHSGGIHVPKEHSEDIHEPEEHSGGSHEPKEHSEGSHTLKEHLETSLEYPVCAQELGLSRWSVNSLDSTPATRNSQLVEGDES